MLSGPALRAWGDRKPEGNCAFSLPSGFLSPQAMRTGQNHRAEVLGSVSKIIELQRHPEVCLAQERDGLLQVVALLADDPHLFALDLRLYLEL
jgi:hypothetical protein